MGIESYLNSYIKLTPLKLLLVHYWCFLLTHLLLLWQVCWLQLLLGTDQSPESTSGVWNLVQFFLTSNHSLLPSLQGYFRKYSSCYGWSNPSASFFRNVKYHEPEYWKFGEEGNKYFRHATGQIYAISKDLATYISINQ